MSRSTAVLILVVACTAMAAYTAPRLRVTSDVTNFMPRRADLELVSIARRLADSELMRTMVLTIGEADEAGGERGTSEVTAAGEAEGEGGQAGQNAREVEHGAGGSLAPETGNRPADTATLIAAARELAHALAGNPNVAWIRTGIDPEQLRHLYEIYFPRRYYFFSDHPERDIPPLLTDAALRADAERLKSELAMPTSTLLDRAATADPIFGFQRTLDRFTASRRALRTQDGVFVTDDGRWAAVFLASKSRALDSGPQARLLDDIQAAFAKINEAYGGKLRLEEAGANRFAVAAEASIKHDVYLIAAVSFLGVAALFLAFFRSLGGFGLAILPALVGMLTATTLGLLVLGNVDGLTLAFGAALMGVAVDYSIHVLAHHALAGGTESAAVTARRLGGSLTLGALTTIASFAALGMTSFPGFREIGFVSATGIAASLVVTLWLLPAIIPASSTVPALSVDVAATLGRAVTGLERHRRVLAAIAIAVFVLAAAVLPRLRWTDDLSELSSLDPRLTAEDVRVRERVSAFDVGRFAIVLAKDAEEAVAINDRVHDRLEEMVDKGELEGMRSLHALLWATPLQERNWKTLTRDPGLYDRVDRVFSAEGFRHRAFEPFRKTIQSDPPPPPPLTPADLADSPLSDLVSSLLFGVGDRSAAVTYLRGARSTEALRSAIAGIDGAHLFDQKSFINELYGAFRATTFRQTLLGAFLVALVLAVRYRRARPALAAFLPSVLVPLTLLSLYVLAGIQTNLLHLVSLIMVMGMGVDYGIFIVDGSRQGRPLGATMLSLLLSCLTTVFVFGTLALSDQPGLRAMGMTTGLGIILSLLFAPLSLVVAEPRAVRASRGGET